MDFALKKNKLLKVTDNNNKKKSYRGYGFFKKDNLHTKHRNIFLTKLLLYDKFTIYHIQ